MLPLSLSKASVRFLDTLPPKQYRQVTRKVIMLMADPRPADAERLKGYEYSRVTVGEYRVIFDVRDGVLRVVAIASATTTRCTGGSGSGVGCAELPLFEAVKARARASWAGPRRGPREPSGRGYNEALDIC